MMKKKYITPTLTATLTLDPATPLCGSQPVWVEAKRNDFSAWEEEDDPTSTEAGASSMDAGDFGWVHHRKSLFDE